MPAASKKWRQAKFSNSYVMGLNQISMCLLPGTSVPVSKETGFHDRVLAQMAESMGDGVRPLVFFQSICVDLFFRFFQLSRSPLVLLRPTIALRPQLGVRSAPYMQFKISQNRWLRSILKGIANDCLKEVA